MGLTLAGATKPWRGYPNMNVVHCIRLMHRVGGPGVALPRGSPKGKVIPIGTVPAGAHVRNIAVFVKTAYGAGFTLDIGGNPNTASPPVFAYPLGPSWDLSAIAISPPLTPPASPTAGFQTFGFVPEDVEFYARLNGAGEPATGELDVVIQFYVNKT